MKAAVLSSLETIDIKTVAAPEPGPGEVVIKVQLAGLCGSDHSLFRGGIQAPLPVIPGHEAVGRVAAVGPDVQGLSVGQRVTIQPNFACGTCPVCRAGFSNVCPSKIRLGIDVDGVFAEFVKAPANYVWPLPDDLEDDLAVLTEPLAVAAHALNRTRPQQGQRALVLGAGLIGLLALQLVVHGGAEVTACDLDDQRLALARQLGATDVLGPQASVEAVLNSFDVIYETSGSGAALAQAIKLAAPRATIVMLGLPAGEPAVPASLIVRKELQILGSMIYSNEFPQALQILQSGQLQADQLITARLGLDELQKGLRDFGVPGRIKTLVTL